MGALAWLCVVGLIFWMSYIDEIAGAIRCLIPPALIPDGDTTVLFRSYAVLALAKGERVRLEDVHDAWAAWMSGQDPEHGSLKPFGVLAPEVRLSLTGRTLMRSVLWRETGGLGDRATSAKYAARSPRASVGVPACVFGGDATRVLEVWPQTYPCALVTDELEQAEGGRWCEAAEAMGGAAAWRDPAGVVEQQRRRRLLRGWRREVPGGDS